MGVIGDIAKLISPLVTQIIMMNKIKKQGRCTMEIGVVVEGEEQLKEAIRRANEVLGKKKNFEFNPIDNSKDVFRLLGKNEKIDRVDSNGVYQIQVNFVFDNVKKEDKTKAAKEMGGRLEKLMSRIYIEKISYGPGERILSFSHISDIMEARKKLESRTDFCVVASKRTWALPKQKEDETSQKIKTSQSDDAQESSERTSEDETSIKIKTSKVDYVQESSERTAEDETSIKIKSNQMEETARDEGSHEENNKEKKEKSYGQFNCKDIREKGTSMFQQFLGKIEEEEAWISEKQQLLTVPDLGDNIAAVQGLLKIHDAFETGLSVHGARCTDICGQGQMLIEDRNHHANNIAQLCDQLRIKMSNLGELSSMRKSNLTDNSAYLQFMWKADVVESWITDKESHVKSDWFCRDLFSVQTLLTKQVSLD